MYQFVDECHTRKSWSKGSRVVGRISNQSPIIWHCSLPLLRNAQAVPWNQYIMQQSFLGTYLDFAGEAIRSTAGQGIFHYRHFLAYFLHLHDNETMDLLYSTSEPWPLYFFTSFVAFPAASFRSWNYTTRRTKVWEENRSWWAWHLSSPENPYTCRPPKISPTRKEWCILRREE